MVERPQDPDRYHAALVLSVDLARDALRHQFEAFRDAAKRREELTRLIVAVSALVVGSFGLVTERAYGSGFVFGSLATASMLNATSLIILLSGREGLQWNEGPSLEALAAETSDPTWSDDRLMGSLLRTYPLIRRRNAQVLRDLSRRRGMSFFSFALGLVLYLSAGAYILWGSLHG